jgi:hypothetical protein
MHTPSWRLSHNCSSLYKRTSAKAVTSGAVFAFRRIRCYAPNQRFAYTTIKKVYLMPRGDRVLVQCWVPEWVRASLQAEAAKEQRSVSNLLAKWLSESCERVPETSKKPAPKMPVGAAPSGPQPFKPPLTDEPLIPRRHALRDPSEMPPEEPR